MVTTIPIDLPAAGAKHYDVVVGARGGAHGDSATLLADMASFIDIKKIKGRVVPVVIDKKVYQQHGKAIRADIERVLVGKEIIFLSVAGGEKSKSLASYSDLMEKLLRLGLERGSWLVVIGGGVLGDLGGFCAGTLLRGIDFIQVPTTLLAMVDSSVGGKTGINAAVGKNLIGVFYQPRLVLADLSLLATLPQVEVSAGIAEIIKYGAIMDGAFFSYLEDNMAGLKKREPSILRHAVERSVAMKAAVVSGDEKEQRPDGGRMLLNFGHTFAHAIEAELHYRPLARGGILHGQAVGFGMLLAAHFSEYLGVGQHLVPRLKKLLQAASLPTSFADLPPLSKTGWRAERLLAHMYHDKKVSGQQLVFVLLESLGRAVVQRGVAATDLVQFLQKHYL